MVGSNGGGEAKAGCGDLMSWEASGEASRPVSVGLSQVTAAPGSTSVWATWACTCTARAHHYGQPVGPRRQLTNNNNLQAFQLIVGQVNLLGVLESWLELHPRGVHGQGECRNPWSCTTRRQLAVEQTQGVQRTQASPCVAIIC